MSLYLPVGFDHADGTTKLPAQPWNGSHGVPPGVEAIGTPTPAGATSVGSIDGNVQPIDQVPDTPEIERAEQGTFRTALTMAWSACLTAIQGLGRGTFVQDSFGNVWRILSSHIQRTGQGDSGVLSYVGESISFDSPPNEYQMTPTQLDLDITKHPRYAWAILPYASDQSTYYQVPSGIKVYYTDIKQAVIRMIQTYQDSPVYPSATTINGAIHDAIFAAVNGTNGVGTTQVTVPNPNYLTGDNFSKPGISISDFSQVQKYCWDGVYLTSSSPRYSASATNPQYPDDNVPFFSVPIPVDLSSPTDTLAILLAAAYELIYKLWRNETTPYIPGFTITWSEYFFAPVYENPGGYVENPVGIVPNYFISPAQDGRNTIFDQMVAISPQLYSSTGLTSGTLDISWLRQADEVTYERTWFKVTHTWIGSPIGHWDRQLYPPIGTPRPQNANEFVVLN